MRKITGELVSTKPISLSRASKLMSRFASVENGSSVTVSMYIQRTVEALNSLVQRHEFSKPSMGTSLVKQEILDEETMEKSRKRKVKMDEGTVSGECDNGDIGEVEKKRKKKNKKKSDGKTGDKTSDS